MRLECAAFATLVLASLASAQKLTTETLKANVYASPGDPEVWLCANCDLTITYSWLKYATA